MQYNQKMIDLVYAIRSRLSDTEKSSIKTTNPELLEDLADIYRLSSDQALCAHIEELLTLAGKTWLDLLHKSPKLKEETSLVSRVVPAATKTSAAERKIKTEFMVANDAQIFPVAPSLGQSALLAFG